MWHSNRKYPSTLVALCAVALLACGDWSPTEPLTSDVAFGRGSPNGPKATVEDCPDGLGLFQALCASVDAGINPDGTDKTPMVTFKSDRDEFGLIGKVVEASSKLSQDKIGDAIQKIGDFRSKVEALGLSSGKISGDVQGVLELADAVIAQLEAMLGS